MNKEIISVSTEGGSKFKAAVAFEMDGPFSVNGGSLIASSAKICAPVAQDDGLPIVVEWVNTCASTCYWDETIEEVVAILKVKKVCDAKGTGLQEADLAQFSDKELENFFRIPAALARNPESLKDERFPQELFHNHRSRARYGWFTSVPTTIRDVGYGNWCNSIWDEGTESDVVEFHNVRYFVLPDGRAVQYNDCIEDVPEGKDEVWCLVLGQGQWKPQSQSGNFGGRGGREIVPLKGCEWQELPLAEWKEICRSSADHPEAEPTGRVGLSHVGQGWGILVAFTKQGGI